MTNENESAATLAHERIGEFDAELTRAVIAGEAQPPLNTVLDGDRLRRMTWEEVLAAGDEHGIADMKASRIAEARAYLANTDYAAAKIAEGAATAAEYAEVLAKRQDARRVINGEV